MFQKFSVTNNKWCKKKYKQAGQFNTGTGEECLKGQKKMYGENRIVDEKVSSVGRVQQGDGDLGEKDKSIIRKDSMNRIKTIMETTANSFGHAEKRTSRVGDKD